MVSLSPVSGRNTQDAFHDDLLAQDQDDPISDDTPLLTSSEKPYRRIKTTGFIIVHVLITTILGIFIGGFPLLCEGQPKRSYCPHHSSYSIALYTHGASYLVHLIFDRIYHSYQDYSRRDGYLEFYRKTRNLRRTPLVVISMGNAILVALIKFLEDRDDDFKSFRPPHVLLTLISIEILLILIALIWYLVLTIRFNKKRLRPDATQEDYLSIFVAPQASINEVGFRAENYREDVLEKQADLIRYLRERNRHLSHMILALKQESSRASSRS